MVGVIIGFIFILVISWFLGVIFTDDNNIITTTLKGLGMFVVLGLILKILSAILGLGMTAHGL